MNDYCFFCCVFVKIFNVNICQFFNTFVNVLISQPCITQVGSDCHSPDWWVCCFKIDVSGCTWAMTPVLGDPNVTAFLKALSLHRFYSTCIPTTCQLHVAENSFTLTTYVSPFKANSSANWKAVCRQIWRGCHTSVDSGDLNQSPPKQSAVCSTCIIPAPAEN